MRHTFTLHDADQLERIDAEAERLLVERLTAWKDQNPETKIPPETYRAIKEQVATDAAESEPPHTYEVCQHDPDTGEPIMREIQALISGPLAAALGGALKGHGGGVSPETVMEALSGDALGNAVKSGLLSLRDRRLTKALLVHTTRDGKPLRLDGAFNKAYARNYGELDGALYEVIKYNRFLSLPAGLRSVLGSLGTRLTGNARQPSEPSPQG